MGDVWRRFVSGRCEVAADIQVVAGYCQRAHGSIQARTQGEPVGPSPFCDVIGGNAGGAGKIAAGVEIAALKRERINRGIIIRSRAEPARRGPTAAVPYSEVTSTAVARSCEQAAGIKTTPGDYNRIDGIQIGPTHSRAQCGPTAPVPFGDGVDGG